MVSDDPHLLVVTPLYSAHLNHTETNRTRQKRYLVTFKHIKKKKNSIKRQASILAFLS